MPTKLLDQQHGQALLDSIRAGGYPDSEDIISADLPATAAPDFLKLLQLAREDIKLSIRKTSINSAQDINGWIAQAKQLRNDIEDSKGTAQQIAHRNLEGEHLRAQTRDAANKVDLLAEEVEFTETLMAVYDRVRRSRRKLDTVLEALQHKDPSHAAQELVKGETEVEGLRTDPNNRVVAVLRARLDTLREKVTADLLERWRSMIYVGLTPHSINIKQQTFGYSLADLDSLANALHFLGLLGDTTARFCRDTERAIIGPLLLSHREASVGCLSINGEVLSFAEAPKATSVENLLNLVGRVIEYLSANLPFSIMSKVSELLGPSLVSSILSVWLVPALPKNLDGIGSFQTTTVSVLQFADALDSYKWPGKAMLVAWIQEVPQLWLKRRQELSLETVRKFSAPDLENTETVERMEIQVFPGKEDIHTSTETDDNWNAEWSDEEEASRSKATISTTGKAKSTDEDVNVWGLGQDANGGDQDTNSEKVQNGEEDADAWEWGDEEEAGEGIISRELPKASPKRLKTNGICSAPHNVERQVTLKETYNITALVKDLLKLIIQAVSDAENLKKESTYKALPIASASEGLLTLPGLLLTMYRAIAPSCYAFNPSGNMLLYNDSLWLVDRLRGYSPDHFASNLRPNVSAISTFGKRAYGKEMESQRTILSDLLDGAQGFSNCTVAPFAQECEIAISSTVDRLRQVYQQWQPILSHSALLRSLGSLLSTVINKIIVDVEDMSIISEPESQRLTALCDRVAALEDLFLPQRPGALMETQRASVPLTAVYTPGWLKFQYLVNILESSLVDIKFLWEEGELRLEFEAEELVDLIEALFADSEHRRRAVGDIRSARQ